jgi:hypothetical protein
LFSPAPAINPSAAPGGICYIETHQTFPFHRYPQDYFQFSKEALTLIFADAGLEVVDTGHLYPRKDCTACRDQRVDYACLSFLNVYYIGRKGAAQNG